MIPIEPSEGPEDDVFALMAWAQNQEAVIEMNFEMDRQDSELFRASLATQMALQVEDAGVIICFSRTGMFEAYRQEYLSCIPDHFLLAPISIPFAYWGADVRIGQSLPLLVMEALGLPMQTGEDDADASESLGRAFRAYKASDNSTKRVVCAQNHQNLIAYFQSYIPESIKGMLDFYDFVMTPEFQQYQRAVAQQNTVYPT